MNISRNALCPCGSGLKYKKCCLQTKPNHVLEIHDDFMFKAGKIHEATNYKRGGDLYQADKIYHELSGMYPEDENIQYNWAKIKTLIGDYKGAVKLYEKSMKTSSKTGDFQGVNLCKYHIEKIENEDKESREFYKYLKDISGNYSLNINKIREKYFEKLNLSVK